MIYDTNYETGLAFTICNTHSMRLVRNLNMSKLQSFSLNSNSVLAYVYRRPPGHNLASILLESAFLYGGSSQGWNLVLMYRLYYIGYLLLTSSRNPDFSGALKLALGIILVIRFHISNK